MHTENAQQLLSLQPTLLKHAINGTTKRNNTEDQKALNSKQQSVYTKQTGGYMMHLCHFKLGSGMICGTVFIVYCLHSQKLAAGTWTIVDTLSYSQWYWDSFEWCGEETTLIIDHFEHDLGIRVNLDLVCDLILCRQCIKNEPHFHHMIIRFENNIFIWSAYVVSCRSNTYYYLIREDGLARPNWFACLVDPCIPWLLLILLIVQDACLIRRTSDPTQ